MKRVVFLLFGAVGFGLLVICNAGGYRYGVGDQAFYIPIVMQQLAPELYPYDTAVIAAQDRFFVFDDWFAPILQVTGLSVSQGFLIAYLVTLGVLYAAIVGLGRTIYASWWAVGFLVVGLTMRHRIPDTAVNTLEGYFHPRQLAFAVGLGAVVIFLKGRTWLSLGVVILAMLAHPTTGLWFAVLVGSAALVSDQRSRPGVVGVAIAAAAVAIWAVVGPLRAQLVVMDQTWVEVLAIKDYLFVSDWPLSTWAGNLGMAVLVGMIYRTRRSLGLVSRQETGMVIGCAVLLGLFFASLPLASAHVALVVQLQVNRIFWLFDIIGSTYLGWLLVECPVSSRVSTRWLRVTPRPAIVAIILAVAMMRGGYLTVVDRAGEPFADDKTVIAEWPDVMEWAASQPVGTHFIADPGHAARYGTSIRVAAARDVYLEVVKDTGMAIYSADIAHRVSERIDALGSFEMLRAERARALAARYDLDFLITEHELDLPEAWRTSRFHVYALTN